MNIEDFGKTIKEKYPQYQDMTDADLGQKMIEKYPQYQDMVGKEPSKSQKVGKFLEGHGVIKGISDIVGTTGLGKGIAQSIFLKFTKEGKDTQKMMEEGKITPEEFDNIVGEGLATPKEVIGSAAKTALAVGAVGVKPAATVAGRLGFGTALGAGLGAAGAIEEEGGIKEVATGAVIGGGIGLATAGLLEGIGAGLRKFSQSQYAQKRTGYTYLKELQPPKKEIAKDIEKGFKTFGEEVADVVDDKGSPVYTGSYKTLLEKAKNQLQQKGDLLKNLLKESPTIRSIRIRQDEVAKDIVETMQNRYGKLSDIQIKQIQFEVNRMPKFMTPTTLLKAKRMFDNLIPDSFWSKLDDPAQAFPSLVKYHLRDNARKLINEKTANPIIQKINNEMSIAMDVRKLAASQMATRAARKISGEGGFFYKMIGRFIDDYVFNPAITTRSAQAIRQLGMKTGQTIQRQLGRFGAIKGIEAITRLKKQSEKPI